MSVIGYDGKIRPKSVAVNYKPQGMMTPEQMERIHAAKPDYVSGVMKMFDSFNANMTDTIGYFDKARKEREAVEHEEKKADLTQRLFDIRNNPDLTTEQQAAEVEKVKAEVESEKTAGKWSATGRAREQDLMSVVQNAANQIQLEDNRQKAAIRAAGLEAGLNTIVKNAGTDIQAWMAEQIRNNPNLELKDLRALLEKRFDEFAGPDTTNGLKPVELAEYNKNRDVWIGNNMLVFGKIRGDVKREKNKLDIATSSYAAADTATTGAEAWNAGYNVAGKYVGSTIDENEQIQNANGTFITWAKRLVDKNVTEYDRIIANISGAYTAKVEELGAEGAEQWASAEMERAQKLLFDTRNLVQLNTDYAYKMLEQTHGGKLTQGEKDYYKTFLQDNADALKKQVDKTMEQKKLNATATVRKAEKEKGMSDFLAVKDFLSGKSADLPEHLVDTCRKLDPKEWATREKAAQANGYTKEKREQMQDIVLSQRYAGLSKADRDLAYVYDSCATIAGLDMNRNSAQNLYDIMAIEDAAGKLYGYGSPQHKAITMFATENMQKEKNSMGNQAVTNANRLFLNGNTLQSEEGRAILNSDPTLYKRYYQFLTLAQEIPYDGSAWFDKVGELETVARQMKAFDGITTADGFKQGVVAAFDTANKMPKEKQAAVAEGGVVLTKGESELERKISKMFRDYEDEEALLLGEYEVERNKKGEPIRDYAKESLSFDFWSKKSKELGVPVFDGSGVDDIKRYIRLSLVVGDKIEKELKKRKEIKKELEKLGLPTTRRPYTSFLGIGGYEINKWDEIELGTNISGQEELRSREMEEIIKQYHYYKNLRANIKNPKEELAKIHKAKEDAVNVLRKKVEATKFFAAVSAGEQKVEANGMRTDGTTKGDGWFGRVDLGGGKFATEISITTEIAGVSVDIPLLNPLCTKKEVDVLVRLEKVGKDRLSKEDKKALEGIYEKAHEWAKQRWRKRLSPYIMKGENVLPLPKDEEGGEKK